MKTLDTITKRIFVVAVSVSLVLLSLSAFLYTIQHATAEPKQGPVLYQPTLIGLGIVKDTGYYMYSDAENGGRYSVLSVKIKP